MIVIFCSSFAARMFVRCDDGEFSGVIDCECLCPGVLGAITPKRNIEERFRSVRAGSEDGVRGGPLAEVEGVASGGGGGDLTLEPVKRRANLRKGEIERESVSLLDCFFAELELAGVR